MNTPASSRDNKEALTVVGGDTEGRVQSNYRLLGNDFMEVTPSPRVNVFIFLLLVVKRKWTTMLMLRKDFFFCSFVFYQVHLY